MDVEACVATWAHAADPESWTALSGQFPILRPHGARGPQAGYMGPKYEQGGTLILGQNPRFSESKRGFKEGDDTLYRLQREFASDPTPAKFWGFMEFQRSFMSAWDIFKAIEFPESFGLQWESVAYLNSLQCPTHSDKFNWKVWKECAPQFLCKQLALLQPSVIVCIGKVALQTVEQFSPSVKSDWMPHPTGTYAKVNRDLMNEKLNACRTLVTTTRNEK